MAVLNSGYELRESHSSSGNKIHQYAHTIITISVRQNSMSSFIHIVDLAAQDLEKIEGALSS
jgi:hypothetical protein